ncbi:hypothetical protein, partial [Massilia sp. Root1485]|uniref:hypothetical protein n=1 Tax=Massilia sp. Root1485 TaxID=1736472 RepID=UPI001E5A7A25
AEEAAGTIHQTRLRSNGTRQLRARVVDPHIKGPISTGWGATDYTEQEAQKILLTVPATQ